MLSLRRVFVSIGFTTLPLGHRVLLSVVPKTRGQRAHAAGSSNTMDETTDAEKGMEEMVVVAMDPLRKRRYNTRLRAPSLAALTTVAMSRVRRELRELIDEVEALLPPVPTSL